ncbi:hypothetical protein DFJ77DRAFT_32223 [Powellomyces hirtus]|nr:hypothetical protein DFJ77DRAFT_32223 [Powellomyces hirtus]
MFSSHAFVPHVRPRACSSRMFLRTHSPARVYQAFTRPLSPRMFSRAHVPRYLFPGVCSTVLPRTCSQQASLTHVPTSVFKHTSNTRVSLDMFHMFRRLFRAHLPTCLFPGACFGTCIPTRAFLHANISKQAFVPTHAFPRRHVNRYMFPELAPSCLDEVILPLIVNEPEDVPPSTVLPVSLHSRCRSAPSHFPPCMRDTIKRPPSPPS